MADDARRVAVTGIGLVTALGIGTEPTWQALVEGRSGVGPIESYDVSSLRTQIGGEATDFEPKEWVHPKILRKLTRGDQFALVGSILAMEDAGLELAEEQSQRAGLFLGSNKEVSDLMHLLEPTLAARNPDGSVDMVRFGESAHGSAYPLFYVEGLQAASLFYISERFQLKGVNTYFAGTAEAGMTAVGRGYRAVRRGEADIVIAGGYDDAVSWWNTTKLDDFDGYLTGQNELGAGACKPFDRDRDGTVLGEGSAFLVLEELESARSRGARSYAEVVGFGGGADALGLPAGVTAPKAVGLRSRSRRLCARPGSSPEPSTICPRTATARVSATRAKPTRSRACSATARPPSLRAASSPRPGTPSRLPGRSTQPSRRSRSITASCRRR